MHVVDVKELSVRNRALRARRVELLRKSVTGRRYHVNPDQIAIGIIKEACIDAVSHRAGKCH